MFNFFAKSDEQIKDDVISELTWDQRLNSENVKVRVKDGIVTLTGTVPHYMEKRNAEQAAQRVGGVKAVADDLEVKGIFDKSDEEIAQAAVSAFKWNYSVPGDLKISVDKGWVNLSGEVDWDYQRNSARDTVSDLMCVRGVSNNITIRSKTQPSDVKARIEQALKRSAEAEGRKIKVEMNGNKVILSGNVHSISEFDDARHAAWMAPGVVSVENNITVSQ